MTTSIHMISLGCSRNDVDTEQLAARLEAGGFALADDPEQADVIVVNTCGFIEQAKKDSIDTLLAASDYKRGRAQAVVAVGCMAQRYGQQLAASLPEADAVLGFDAYPQIAQKIHSILEGERIASHIPQDRRKLLPLSPVQRHGSKVVIPGHQDEATLARLAPPTGPRIMRKRLESSPFAPLKIASGCDRRCAFCAIPSFRGAYISRSIEQIVAEARWLVTQGVREVMLVSENSSSYGKDLQLATPFETLLTQLNKVDGLEWIRVSYLQPAEIKPGMFETMAALDKVVPYFDLSFQHASHRVLRRMRRFGNPDSFLALIDQIRTLAPHAGIRSNVIVGFPGESDEDLATLHDFLIAARMDVVGVFGYSDEEGTAAADLDGHLDSDEIAWRVDQTSSLVDELCAQSAADRIGQTIQVMVESIQPGSCIGRAAHQGPEVDGTTTVKAVNQIPHADVGDFVTAVVTDCDGIDLIAQPIEE